MQLLVRILMKNIALLILTLCFINCNSDKKKPELKTTTKKLNADLIGIYEYKTPEQSESHYIIIDTLKGNYNGFYFGTENISQGVFFYGNEMKNLNLNNGKISFEIGKRDLYETTRFRIVKRRRNLEKDSIIQISKRQLKYNGKLTKNVIKVNCISEFDDCCKNEMSFEKLTKNS